MSKPTFIPSCSPVRDRLWAKAAASGEAMQASATSPTSQGPTEAPRSPPAAIMAYITTPPAGNLSEEIIRLPGQSIELQKPVRAQPIRPTKGKGETAATR